MPNERVFCFVCGSATDPPGVDNIQHIGYTEGHRVENMHLSLPDLHARALPMRNRLLDLLEIAAYVYCADRLVSRGERSNVEFQAWARSIHLHLQVRDIDFWSSEAACSALSYAISQIAGDKEWRFSFEPMTNDTVGGLFNETHFPPDLDTETQVTLFSGGIDSLAGIIDTLETTDHKEPCSDK